jgi:cytochrome c peroxidase
MSKNLKRWLALVVLTTLLLTLVFAGQGLAQQGLTPVEELGEFLYFDQNLSDCGTAGPGEICDPAGQSCASCHLPSAGFVDPDSDIPVSQGVIHGRFGGRNSPASAYAMYAPTRYFDAVEGLWIGGQFWDSRATGEVLGDPLADQALGPFLNSVEMANPDKATVVGDALGGAYGGLFAQECGAGALSDPVYVEAAYDCIALSIAAFERTPLFAQFNSKYDAYLQACLAEGGQLNDCAQGIGKEAKKASKIFTNEEWAGLQLFMGENNNDGILDKGEGAMCAACHVAEFTAPVGNVVVPAWSQGMVPPVFTDFTYDNLGVPKSEHPLLVDAPADHGLGTVVGDAAENGKFKVMTLRNIGLTAPYAHNGFFVRLKDITHFYNTRDLLPDCVLVKNPKPGKNCWDVSEVPETVNANELGNLGLSDKDEDALVEFMKTLSDGWTP